MADGSLVVDQFKLNRNANRGEKILEIRGRAGGIIGKIVSLLGLDEKSYVIVTYEEVVFRFVSLRGMTTINCPLDTIRSSRCGVSKPMWALWGAVLTILGGVVAVISEISKNAQTNDVILLGGIISVVIGLGLIIYWRGANELVITFSTGDMLDLHGLAFSKRTSKGKEITIKHLLEAIDTINRAIVAVRASPKAVGFGNGAASVLTLEANDEGSVSELEGDDDLRPITPPPSRRRTLNPQSKNGQNNRPASFDDDADGLEEFDITTIKLDDE